MYGYILEPSLPNQPMTFHKTLDSALKTSKAACTYTVEREHSYIHNGEARRAIIVRKARSSKLHQVIQYADGLFSDAAPYPSFA